MKYLGIDYGQKRIGLAVGSLFPRGLGVIDADLGQDKIIQHIGELIKEHEVDLIVLGMPTKTERQSDVTQAIEKFGRSLEEKLGLSVIFEPEDFTSVEAEDILIESGKKFSRKTGEKDELSAVLILERFIERERRNQA